MVKKNKDVELQKILLGLIEVQGKIENRKLAQIQKIEAVNREGLHRGIQEIRKAETSGFIGREKELDYYANKILQKNLAVISGIAGVGKSSLAAFLAKRFVDPPKIFWHSFKAGEILMYYFGN